MTACLPLLTLSSSYEEQTLEEYSVDVQHTLEEYSVDVQHHLSVTSRTDMRIVTHLTAQVDVERGCAGIEPALCLRNQPNVWYVYR